MTTAEAGPGKRRDRRPSRRFRGRLRSRVAWGFVDQGFSSVTNFALALLAGRGLDPRGLGVVTIGFAGYVLSLVFQRALISDPLVVVSVREEGEQRRAMTAASLTLTLAGGLAMTIVLLILGVIVPGPIGRGLVIFSPWILPLVVQDLWRFILFRDGRGAAAAVNDGVWLFGMLVALPLPLLVRTDWAVVAWWASGATMAAVVGFFQLRVGPEAFGRAWRWWRHESWPFGRWLAGDRAINYAGPQVVPFVVAALLGSGDVGGLRAVQSVFAPMTLLGPTVALPGLPAIAAGLHSAPRRARTVAVQLSALVVGASIVYTVVLAAIGGALIRGLFGSSFAGFTNLVVPIAIGQVLIGAQAGFVLMLKAARRGRALVLTHAVSSTATLLAVYSLVRVMGIRGAAWGLAIGDGLEAVLYAAFAWPLGSRPGSTEAGAGSEPTAPIGEAFGIVQDAGL